MKRLIMMGVLLMVALPTGIFALDTKNYMGFGFGQSSIDIDWGPPILGASVSIDDSDYMLKGFAGVLFNPYFGLELGYTDLGKFTVDERAGPDTINVTFGGSAPYLAAVGYAPLSEKAHFYGKLGFAVWDIDRTITVNRPSVPLFYTTTESDFGADFMFGIGFQYTIEPVLLRAEFERYYNVGPDGGEDVDVFGLAIAFLL